MTDRQPFNADSPFDGLADELRGKIADVALQFIQDPRSQALEESDQLECFIIGALVGVMGAVQTMVHPESHDAIVEVVEVFVSSAAAMAAEIRQSMEARDGLPN